MCLPHHITTDVECNLFCHLITDLVFILVLSQFLRSNFYHANVTYVQQTISSLPSYWSMSYSNRTQVTTVTIKGKANGCIPDLFQSNACSGNRLLTVGVLLPLGFKQIGGMLGVGAEVGWWFERGGNFLLIQLLAKTTQQTLLCLTFPILSCLFA